MNKDTGSDAKIDAKNEMKTEAKIKAKIEAETDLMGSADKVPEDPEYWAERERAEGERDISRLAKLAYAERNKAGCFAFCRLTGYAFPPPAIDRFSHRTYACRPVEGMTPDLIWAFCQDMIEQGGPFSEEAEEILAGIDESKL